MSDSCKAEKGGRYQCVRLYCTVFVCNKMYLKESGHKEHSKFEKVLPLLETISDDILLFLYRTNAIFRLFQRKCKWSDVYTNIDKKRECLETSIEVEDWTHKSNRNWETSKRYHQRKWTKQRPCIAESCFRLNLQCVNRFKAGKSVRRLIECRTEDDFRLKWHQRNNNHWNEEWKRKIAANSQMALDFELIFLCWCICQHVSIQEYIKQKRIELANATHIRFL